jgi:hypothetical protein
MLDGRDAMVARTEYGRTAGIDDVIRMRGKFDRIVEPEAQTRVRCGR